MTTPSLPEKLSDLLELAVRDAQKAEQTPGCGYWPDDDTGEAAADAMALIRKHYRSNEGQAIGRAPWDVYLTAASMLREAGL